MLFVVCELYVLLDRYSCSGGLGLITSIFHQIMFLSIIDIIVKFLPSRLQTKGVLIIIGDMSRCDTKIIVGFTSKSAIPDTAKIYEKPKICESRKFYEKNGNLRKTGKFTKTVNFARKISKICSYENGAVTGPIT